MPNAKLYIEDSALMRIADRLDPALAALRETLCQLFGVTEQACHLVVIPVRALTGQTPVNLELTLLHKPDRSRGAVDAACGQVQARVAGLLGLPAAIRCTLMQPESYVVRR